MKPIFENISKFADSLNVEPTREMVTATKIEATASDLSSVYGPVLSLRTAFLKCQRSRICSNAKKKSLENWRF